MTRLGPLTSQALVGPPTPEKRLSVLRLLKPSFPSPFLQGRSPYDILVPGTGEANLHEPPQAYDERGRPFNAETRRINRHIIRAHNEVMQAIGVAEPDSLLTTESETSNQLVQQMDEDKAGIRLLPSLRMIGTVGVWGAEPLRQRVLVGFLL